MLNHNSAGNYQFLLGIEPYSCGVIADKNFELVRVTVPKNIKWDLGFKLINRFLQKRKLNIHALASIELRSPQVRSMNKFIEFNSEYISLIESYGLLSNGLNPIARTNVVPYPNNIKETNLHAFSFTRPAKNYGSVSFVVAGSGELKGSDLDSHNIVRCKDTSQQGLRDKILFVRDVMSDRLNKLGVTWSHVTSTSIYTIQPVSLILNTSLTPSIGDASRFGLQVFSAQPPIFDIEFEMDARGVHYEEFLLRQ